MGLLNKLRNEFVDIIEWIDDTNDTMVWRFPRYQNEIKMNAKLTVRESQVAVFVNEGKVADLFMPGMHTLQTSNLPLLSTLKGWVHGFDSPYKAEVYFLNTKLFTKNKWGTKNPVMLKDPEFGPIRVRAFGAYHLKISDPKKFLFEIVGTDGHFTVDEISDQLRDIVITRFTDALGESKLPALELAASYNELSTQIQTKLNEEFKEFGLDLTKLLVENISFPDEVEQAIDKRSTIGIMGDLDRYTKFQTANAIEKAAQNENGNVASMMGMNMGMNVGSMLNQQMNQQNQPNQVPPSLGTYYMAVNGAQQGPFTKLKMSEFAQSGELTRETLVWKQGLAEWVSASTVPELAGLFNTPPPPPKV